MNIYSAPIEVFRAAMVLVGAEPPNSIDDQTDEAVAARAVYEPMVAAALTAHSWGFATKFEPLTRDAETDLNPAFTYPLPSDLLLVRYVQIETARFDDFIIRGNKLWANCDTTDLTLFYTYRAAEPEWPGDFGLGIVHRLAGYLARGLLQRTTDGDRLMAQGRQFLADARTRDRAQNPGAERDPLPPLVLAWGGRRRNSRSSYRTWV